MTDASTHTDRISPWSLLGVSPEDDPATIRSAWRALVRSYHPDLARTDRAAANRKLAEINAAFDAVCDHEATRCRLDAARRAESARRAEARRRAEAARQSKAARDADAARKAEAAQRERAFASSLKIHAQSWSRADRLAACAARLAFGRARRVLDSGPASHRAAIYL